MITLLKFFVHRHLLTNVLFFGTMILSITIWNNIGKEEMPEFSFDWIRVMTIYPGASAEDVELLVTKPIEKELKSVTGLEEVRSTSAQGSSIIMVFYDPDLPDLREVVQEIKDAVLRAQLPSEVRDIPTFRQFKSTEKAILDVGFTHKNSEFLTPQQRIQLQEIVLSFENQITSLKEISSVSRTSYLQPEIRINLDPDKVARAETDFSTIFSQINANNLRVPLGTLDDKKESRLTALNELESKEELDLLPIQSNYQGKQTLLKDVAEISNNFEKNVSILKINGKEGVFLQLKKSISTDILTAQEKAMNFIKKFKKSNANMPVDIFTMDDESFDVTNRLNIITSNGVIGFFLLLIVLFIFLNFKTGFWVAMGIPFSIAFTLVIAFLAGYSINNMTLAAVIIVLGVVVDDAIIIAENIMRKVESGTTKIEAAIEGTREMFIPILGSMATTVAAFIPLLFFDGHFGKFVLYIPLIIGLMLTGSFLESLFILPSHLVAEGPFKFKERKRTWFEPFEKLYERHLLAILHHRFITILIFCALLFTAFYIFKHDMKFVMFPREESKEVMVKVVAPKGSTREETAHMLAPLESLFISEKQNVVGVRSMIAKSRRGGEVKENEATILIELIPSDHREEPLRKILKRWQEKTDKMSQFKMVKFLKGRWGHSSGSAVEVRVQENSDSKREMLAKKIKEYLDKQPGVTDTEIEKPLEKPEYRFHLNMDTIARFNVTPREITTALRIFIEGSIVYSITKGDEDVDVRVTVDEDFKRDIKKLMTIKIKNKTNNLVPLKKLVTVEKLSRPTNISRVDYKRTTMVYADITGNNQVTPLDIANNLEEQLFPRLSEVAPSAILGFTGEIEDSRDSQSDFLRSTLMVCLLIYLILVLIFNSLFTPIMILSIVPFGLSGVVYILLIHGMSVYGFFAVIGTLGMMGVVINDAIVMVSKFEQIKRELHAENFRQEISAIAATRLRPIILTTVTTVIGIVPTAYGWSGFDSMLAEMMITLGWGLAFGTFITLMLIPIFYTFLFQIKLVWNKKSI